MTAHRHREAVQEADLAHEHRPGRTPMAHESNFRPPLDMVIAPTSGRVESKRQIDEPNEQRLTADPELKGTVTIVGIDTGGRSQPGRGQYVLLTPAVHQRERRRRGLRSDGDDGNDRPKDDRTEARAVLLVRVGPREGRRHRL